MLLPLPDKTPQIGQEVFIAPDAWVIGDVTLGDNVSIFFGAVLRGDILAIKVGKQTNIQEHSLIHTSGGRCPTLIGEQVTVGHRAILHGCTIGNRCLIGMGATVLDESIIEDECLIGAGTLVTEGKRIPRGSLVLGVPGKVVRELTPAEIAHLSTSSADYVKTGALYRTIPALRNIS